MSSGSSSSSSGSSSSSRPRLFDAKAKSECWKKAAIVEGRHPERWRRDGGGNIVCKSLCNCRGCLCFEYDHIIPFSKGGESRAENCQILQTRVNRYKGDREGLSGDDLRSYSCEIEFTHNELDVIEMAVYGDVVRPGNHCRCTTVAEMLGRFKPKPHNHNIPPCKLPTTTTDH